MQLSFFIYEKKGWWNKLEPAQPWARLNQFKFEKIEPLNRIGPII